jgi:NurA-like 5'-3' nuclease
MFEHVKRNLTPTKVRKTYFTKYLSGNLKLSIVRIYLLPVGMFYGLTRKKESQIKDIKNSLIKCYQLELLVSTTDLIPGDNQGP